MAGIVPGILLAAGYLVICTIIGRRRNYPSIPPVNLRTKLAVTGRASWALMMPIIILGGIRLAL